LEYSQLEGLTAMIPGVFASRAAGGQITRVGDKSHTMAPHGFYRCAGDDAWVALAVEDDGRWVALRALLREASVAVPDLPALAERKTQEAELDAAVTAWTSQRSPWEVTRACQGAGVAAFPMMDAARLDRDH